MLDASAIESWLSGGDPAVGGDIVEAVQAVPVSPKMNSPRYNEPDCIAAGPRARRAPAKRVRCVRSMFDRLGVKVPYPT
jgi:hypothetical protein